MIWLSFGKWSSAHGRTFVRERIYTGRGGWTPFIRLSFRDMVRTLSRLVIFILSLASILGAYKFYSFLDRAFIRQFIFLFFGASLTTITVSLWKYLWQSRPGKE